MSMSVSTNASALRPCAYLLSNSHADPDLWEESSSPAKQLMLSQMSASVLAQVNASTKTTLILLNKKMKQPTRPHQIQQSAWGVRSCEWLLDATRKLLAVTQEPHPFLRSLTSTLMSKSKGDYKHGS